jgi:hypothetical protein
MIRTYSLAANGFLAFAFLLSILLSATPCPAESLPEVSSRPPWTLLSESDDARNGYVLYQRKNDDSAASTFRLEAIVDSPPNLVAVAAARNIVDPDYGPANTEKTILLNDGDVIVIYNYIRIDTPFVSDRDIVSRVERTYDPNSRTHRLQWRATDEGPPKKEGVIRLEHSEGSWTFSPEPDGTTRAVYISQTEIAGYLPAWLVDSRMSKTMVDGIEGLRRAVDHERLSHEGH